MFNSHCRGRSSIYRLFTSIYLLKLMTFHCYLRLLGKLIPSSPHSAPPSPLPGFHDSHGGSHAWPRVFDRKRDAVAAVMIGCGHSHRAHDSILTGITSDRSRKGNSKRFWISGISTLFAATCSGMCLVYRAAGSVFLAIKHVLKLGHQNLDSLHILAKNHD